MLEEIPYVDLKPELALFSTRSTRIHNSPVINNGDLDQQQTIMAEILKQRKKTFSQQPSYFVLEEIESESDDTDRQQKCSDENVLLYKKQHFRCLCYILPTILSIILVFLFGFGINQIFRHQSMLPSSVRSNYTSMWTNGSLKFDLINTSISNNYYAALEIRVVIASNYSFFSESNINTYSYIYNNTFHQDNPSVNLLTQVVNSGRNGQFKLTVFLQPWTLYILIVTTSSRNVTGKFSIVVSGPTKVSLRDFLIPPLHQTVYSSELTTQNQVYCRDRCSTPDYEYDFDDDYYYETILVNVSKAGDFTIMSQSRINTYGYIYENSFDPSDTSLNLLMEDDNSGSDDQFKLKAFLRPSIIYVLVVTTFAPHVTGKLSIIASGTSFISLNRVPSYRTTLETTTRRMVQSSYNGKLNVNSPMYCRDSCETFNHYYEAIMVNVDEVGSYNFRSQSDFDAYGSMYTNSFDPSNPFGNLLAYNDDGGEHLQFNLTVVLQPQSTYILVVTTSISYVTGSFQVITSGPISVKFIPVIKPSTTTTEISTTPRSVQSTYSSAWTTGSPSYCRTSCAVSSNYYYEAVQVRVSTSGTFSLISKSSIDTYGYLYNSSFNPFSPSSNLLLQDDDGADNRQFNLKNFLESKFIHILVATTFDPRTTGSFSVSASGPGSVTFSAYVPTTDTMPK